MEQTGLNWREKLATLGLLVTASTSHTSAIRLNNLTNKEVLGEVITLTLGFLKEHGLVRQKRQAKPVKRGEHPVSSLMSRLDKLPKKTNHYFQYIRDEWGYFFDVENDGILDENKVFFLLGKVFEAYDPTANYDEAYQQLSQISQQHSIRFLSWSVDPTISLNVIRLLKEFFEREMLFLTDA